jgi:hypothetical protein
MTPLSRSHEEDQPLGAAARFPIGIVFTISLGQAASTMQERNAFALARGRVMPRVY